MKVMALFLALTLLLLSLFCAGCAPVTPGAGDDIGVLRVSGPNVWLNGAPAGDGDTVRLGNSLATGAGSSALLEFRNGGYLQLDQNTDPIFEWLDQTKCLLVRIFKGQAFLKKERACVEGPNISMVLDSEVNLLLGAPPAPSQVTLLRGSARVTAPVQTKLVPGQQLVTGTQRRGAAVRNLSGAELQSVVRWRGEYRFKPLPVAQPERPALLFPPRMRPPRPSEPAPAPDPATPTGPTESAPKWERGIRVPAELIRRDPEPVLR